MLPAAAENLKHELVTHFIPILERCGARFLDAALEIHEFLAVEFRGERIPIPYTNLQDRSGNTLSFFFSHFADVKEIEKILAGMPAPFHSDISNLVEARFGPELDFPSAQLIQSYLAQRVRQSGRRVWT